MKFTLTYEGPLHTGGAKAKRKHERRKVFHKQLKRLWRVNPLLANWHLPESEHTAAPAIPVLAANYPQLRGIQFVPLVTRELSVEAALHFNILRPSDFKGETHDPDNVVKILVDSLKMPQTADELPEDAIGGLEGESPFFVLMQDDGLLSKISSATDELLQPVNGKEQIERGDIRVSVDVYIRPNFPNNRNLIFFSDDFDIWNHQWASHLEGIRGWPNSELKARTTQCVLRMRVTANNFYMQRRVNWDYADYRDQSATGEEHEKALRSQREQIHARSDEQHQIWNGHLRPLALAFRDELLRRIYGEPPYPKDEIRMLAIDHGMLAGPNPIGDAATGLEVLMRRLQ